MANRPCVWLFSPQHDVSHDSYCISVPSYGRAIQRAAEMCGTFEAVHVSDGETGTE